MALKSALARQILACPNARKQLRRMQVMEMNGKRYSPVVVPKAAPLPKREFAFCL